jgi:hypothetical protein
MSCFSFYLFSFFFYKIGEQEGGISPTQEGGLAQWEEVLGKGGWRVNMVQ